MNSFLVIGVSGRLLASATVIMFFDVFQTVLCTRGTPLCEVKPIMSPMRMDSNDTFFTTTISPILSVGYILPL